MFNHPSHKYYFFDLFLTFKSNLYPEQLFVSFISLINVNNFLESSTKQLLFIFLVDIQVFFQLFLFDDVTFLSDHINLYFVSKPLTDSIW